jgi:peptidoglycan-associated lipoprotein
MKKILMMCLLSSLLMVGCATQDESIENQTDPGVISGGQQGMGDDGSTNGTAMDGSDTQTGIIADESLTVQQMLDEPDSPLSSRVIYFEYDSAKVNDESLAILEAHGNFIASNGNVSVRLEGHADERGSREYNIALGDRRAQSVRRILLFQGASSDQLETISYGEEQPAVLGHDDSAWSKNRRVELVYEVK